MPDNPIIDCHPTVYEFRYKALVESHADLISRFSPDGVISYVSQSYSDFFGQPAEHFLGRSIYDEIPVDERDKTKTRLASLNAQLPTIRGVNSIQTANGEKRTIDWVNSVITTDQGEVVEIQSVGRDITAQLLIEQELKRSNAEFSQFAHLAAHDLKSPLRSSLMLLEVLKEDHCNQLDDPGFELIDNLEIRLARMQRLVSDLLTYSKVGMERIQEKVELQKIGEAVLEDLDSAIAEADVKLKLGKLPAVLGDPTDCSQLLQNLISNAIKFRSKSGPEISVTAQVKDSNCYLFVSDNGIGIDPQFHQKIFEPLTCLHSQQVYAGSGLGLAACDKICRRMGGEIEVESELGKGTTFKVTLTLAPDSTNTASSYSASGETASDDRRWQCF